MKRLRFLIALLIARWRFRDWKPKDEDESA
jgi:hypothetical protein